MKKLRFGLVLLLISTALLGGCATGTAAINDKTTVESIKPGKTTVREVEALLGKPGHTSLERNGEKVYSYYRTETNAKAYVPFLNMTGGVAESKALRIRFNRKGVVTDIVHENNYH